MIRKITIILSLFILVSCAKTETVLITPYSETRNYGYSNAFTGKCLFINVFFSDDESAFSEQEKQIVLNHLEEVSNYYYKKIKDYGKELSIVFSEDDLLIDFESGFIVPTTMEDYLWTYDVISQLYSDYDIEAVKNKYQADNLSFIFNVNKTGQSYSLSQSDKYDSFYDNELCVMYTTIENSENKAMKITSFAYAHEILHLFGAMDLYYPFNPDDKRKELAEKLFPNDIMLLYSYNLNDSTISGVDAYLIGWSDYLDEKYLEFIEPGQRNPAKD